MAFQDQRARSPFTHAKNPSGRTLVFSLSISTLVLSTVSQSQNLHLCTVPDAYVHVTKEVIERRWELSTRAFSYTTMASVLTLLPPTRTPERRPPSEQRLRWWGTVTVHLRARLSSEKYCHNCKRVEDLVGATLPLNGIVWCQQC